MVKSQEKRGTEKVRGKYPPKGKNKICAKEWIIINIKILLFINKNVILI